MNHVLSTHMFVQHRLTAVWLDRIWDAGVPAVELFCARQHLDYRDRGQIVELGHWFKDAELTVHSIHSPFFNDTQWGRSGPQSIIAITETTKAKRIAMTMNPNEIVLANMKPDVWAPILPGELWSDVLGRRHRRCHRHTQSAPEHMEVGHRCR